MRWGPFNLPVGGGGYFRILPYAWTRWGIARLNQAERAPAIFYLHPWEIDPDQPRLPAPWLGRFRHYCNLRQTEARLRALLERLPVFDHGLGARARRASTFDNTARRAAALRLVAPHGETHVRLGRTFPWLPAPNAAVPTRR